MLEAKLTAYKQALNAKMSAEIPEDDLKRAAESHPQVAAHQQQLMISKNRLREYQERAVQGENGPYAKKLANSIEEAEKMIERVASELRPQITEQMRKSFAAEAAKTIGDFEANIEGQRQLEQLWAQRVLEHRQKLENAGDQSLELEIAHADLERAEEVFQRISDRITALHTELGHRRVPINCSRRLLPQSRWRWCPTATWRSHAWQP